MTDYRICRHCGRLGEAGELVHYSRRHYMHAACYLEAGKPLDRLKRWQWADFPLDLLRHYGAEEHHYIA